jgi:hypothetical protein
VAAFEAYVLVSDFFAFQRLALARNLFSKAEELLLEVFYS